MTTSWGSSSRGCNIRGGTDDREESGDIISLGRPKVLMVSGLTLGRDMGGGWCKSCFRPTTQLLSDGRCAGCGGSILPPLTVPHRER